MKRIFVVNVSGDAAMHAACKAAALEAGKGLNEWFRDAALAYGGEPLRADIERRREKSAAHAHAHIAEPGNHGQMEG
ncbi:MAG: hypothetical protein SF123_19670 [Chloroflexota bacterium]|nr:hypothetical protein [Chloroflexota bacterium]